ncbi:hypothetical protein Tco_1102568 [Tanacetum coccineum]
MLEKGLLELVRRERRFLPGDPSSQSKCPGVKVFTFLQLRTLRTTIHYLEIGRLLPRHKYVEKAKLSSSGSNVNRQHASGLVLYVQVVFKENFRQCTSSDGDNAAPCLPRGLAVLDWLVLLPLEGTSSSDWLVFAS